jgi:hypothetical protein
MEQVNTGQASVLAGGASMKILSRWRAASTVLYECEVPVNVVSGLAMRYALQKAVAAKADLSGANLIGAYLSGAYLSGANLSGANLSGADLSGADLSGADLSGADLSGAYLSGADLSGADLSGAYLSGANSNQLPKATPAQAIENLDKVRAFVLDRRERLNMQQWHSTDDWRNRTCAQEVACGTAHCIAGWLQVCTTEPALKTIEPHLAGILAAPIASKMFCKGNDEALEWLESRAYVAETAEVEKRNAERLAKRNRGAA